MHKLYTATYDASIYLQQPDQNAGRDEILEVGKLYYGSTKDIARTLIKFDITSISASINSGNISGSWKAFLNLKAANSEEIPLEYTLYANAISQSWEMGTGTKFDNITSDGVSWKYRDGVNKWWPYDTIAGTADYSTTKVTGSANAEGGVWYTASMASQSFNNESDDVRMDVTNIVKLWVSGSIPNDGLIVHHSLENESNTLDFGVVKFFSKETNTIYQPKLEIVYNDYYFSSSLSPVTGEANDDYKIVITNLKTKYISNSQIKIRVKGRDMFPAKSFGSTFEYDHAKSLSNAYYELEDYITGEVIYPFGEYTKISCDTISNYFIMDLSTLPIQRTYKLRLKIVENGISTIIDDKYIFEIIE